MKVQIGPTCKECSCGVHDGFGGVFCSQHLHKFIEDCFVAVPGPDCPVETGEPVEFVFLHEGGGDGN